MHVGAVVAKPIGRPLCRGCEVELVIRDALRTPNEGLEAGVSPKLVSPCTGVRGRHCKIPYRASHDIGKYQIMGLRTENFHIDVRYCETSRLRMKPQRLAHSSILACGHYSGNARQSESPTRGKLLAHAVHSAGQFA